MRLRSVLWILVLQFAFLCTSSHGAAPEGHVLPVLDVIGGRFIANSDNLKTIFSGLDNDTEIGVIAIAGEYRKGKSFLMNFFLQYLSHRVNNGPATPHTDADALDKAVTDGVHPWLRNIDRDTGFQFKSGRARHTSGIGIWSKPFLVRRANGKKVALLLMDSQGLYDKQTTHDDNVRLFTMVSLLSSSLMLNLAGNLNLKQLMELHYFMDYATSGSQRFPGHKPFQRLTFLIRDYTVEPIYGWEGGRLEVEQYMKPQANQAVDVIDLAKNLTLGFENIDGFTLPGPGRHVLNAAYDGSVTKIDPDFLLHLEKFVVDVSERTDARRPLAFPLQARNFASYVNQTIQVFNSKESPRELMAMNEKVVASEAQSLCEQQIRLFEERMREVLQVKDDAYYLSHSVEQIMQELLERNRTEAADIISAMNSPSGKTWIADFKLTRDERGGSITGLELVQRELAKRFAAIQSNMNKMIPGLKRAAEIRREKKRADEQKMKELENEANRLKLKAERQKAEIDEIHRQARECRKRSWLRKAWDLVTGSSC